MDYILPSCLIPKECLLNLQRGWGYSGKYILNTGTELGKLWVPCQGPDAKHTNGDRLTF